MVLPYLNGFVYIFCSCYGECFGLFFLRLRLFLKYIGRSIQELNNWKQSILNLVIFQVFPEKAMFFYRKLFLNPRFCCRFISRMMHFTGRDDGPSIEEYIKNIKSLCGFLWKNGLWINLRDDALNW
jgi:hypothetical protein